MSIIVVNKSLAAHALKSWLWSPTLKSASGFNKHFWLQFNFTGKFQVANFAFGFKLLQQLRSLMFLRALTRAFWLLWLNPYGFSISWLRQCLLAARALAAHHWLLPCAWTAWVYWLAPTCSQIAQVSLLSMNPFIPWYTEGLAEARVILNYVGNRCSRGSAAGAWADLP